MSDLSKAFSHAHLCQRTITSAISIPIILIIFMSGGLPFTFAIVTIAVFMAYEWSHMIGFENRKWQIVGIFYIVLPLMSLIYLRSTENGFIMILYLFFSVWATDIGAYMFGILIGGPKIAPSISPSKRWTGAIGGLIMAVLVSSLFVAFGFLPSKLFIYMAFLLSILAQIGDLIESYFKRLYSIKDSGSIIPGHGGVLDRTDSIVTTAPVLALFIYLGVLV
jgi:phosphatidate cytidylyltransferase